MWEQHRWQKEAVLHFIAHKVLTTCWQLFSVFDWNRSSYIWAIMWSVLAHIHHFTYIVSLKAHVSHFFLAFSNSNNPKCLTEHWYLLSRCIVGNQGITFWWESECFVFFLFNFLSVWTVWYSDKQSVSERGELAKCSVGTHRLLFDNTLDGWKLMADYRYCQLIWVTYT